MILVINEILHAGIGISAVLPFVLLARVLQKAAGISPFPVRKRTSKSPNHAPSIRRGRESTKDFLMLRM